VSSLLLLVSCSSNSEELNTNSSIDNILSYGDTAQSIQKTIFYNKTIEKTTISRLADTSMYLDDIKSNNALKLYSIKNNTNVFWTQDNLRTIGLDMDSVRVFKNNKEEKITYYSHKNNILYDIDKTYFVYFKNKKLTNKTISISQKLLNGKRKFYEINFKYSYQ
jgi:hypothetical protein